jgi:hypothetical protein
MNNGRLPSNGALPSNHVSFFTRTLVRIHSSVIRGTLGTSRPASQIKVLVQKYILRFGVEPVSIAVNVFKLFRRLGEGARETGGFMLSERNVNCGWPHI